MAMDKTLYSIIDVETDGGSKITDIAIFVHDGKEVIRQYSSLVNPETRIPYRITQLTGIDNQMVEDAPRFFEIAKEIVEFTEGTIFVAHNVGFDYGMVRGEFKTLGFEYSREKLCTVRLSRKLMPGMDSYSLGKLCDTIGIPILDRHRAHGDAEATVELFRRLIELDEGGIVISGTLNANRAPILPPMLDKSVFDGIPETTGVYYFYDQHGEIIYIGKANNIRQRMLSHFRPKAKKAISMFERIADISYTLTGNELVALLLESEEIKEHYPYYNRALKKKKEAFGIHLYENQKGVICLGIGALKLLSDPIATYFTQAQAKEEVEKLVSAFELCPKYCQLESSNTSCFRYQIHQCKGVCADKEEVSDYNKRVEKALSSITFQAKDFVLIEKGKSIEEKAVILVHKGKYKGFGFIDQQESVESFDEFYSFITPRDDNRDAQRIIQSYLKNKKHPKIVYPSST